MVRKNAGYCDVNHQRGEGESCFTNFKITTVWWMWFEYVIWFMIPTRACFVMAGSALADIYSKYAIGWKRVKVIIFEVYDWLKDIWNKCIQPCISDEIPNEEKCIQYIRLSQIPAIV